MFARRRVGFLLLAVGGFGCGSSAEPDDGIDLAASTSEATARGQAPSSITHAKGLTELFVQEDPTIDPSKDAAANADAVAAQVTSALSGCATKKIDHPTGSLTITVTLTSCVTSVGTVSGTVAASVSKTGSAVTVAFTLTSIVMNGVNLSGSLSATTSNGTTYTTHVDVTESGKKVVFDGTLALDASAKGITLDGAGSVAKEGGAAVPFTAKGIHHLFGGCYADAGTISTSRTTTSTRGKSVTVTETVAFDASTPSTGKVTVTVNGTASSSTLPAYGSCPHA